MADLNLHFLRYLEEAIGKANASVASSALNEPASVSVRLNPYKKVPFPGNLSDGKVQWSGHGIFLKERPLFVSDPLFHAGAYYVQDSSSMFVGHVFRNILRQTVRKITDRPLRVLDLCAAPGGKTTDLAASLRESTGDNFILVSNEVMQQRVSVLSSNVAVWGDPCVAVTSDDPSVFSGMTGWFDIILADVPCSGEGMFRKDNEALRQWSEDNVRLCQSRQRRIIADVWPALSDGGVLIYSTCTFNRYENDDNIEWILRTFGGTEVLPAEDMAGELPEGVLETGYGFSLVPGFVRGEGQYCSAVMKNSSEYKEARSGKPVPLSRIPADTARKIESMFGNSIRISMKGNFVKAEPEPISRELDYIGQRLHLISSGCAVGELKKDVLVPDPDLPLSIWYRKDTFPAVELDLQVMQSYLQGNQIFLEGAQTGYLAVTYEGLPVGLVKNIGARCNNLYPKSRRIRMSLK